MDALWKPDHASDESTATALLAVPPQPLVPALERSLSLLPSRVPSRRGYEQTRDQGTPARGRHHIRVCRGLACHVKGSAAVLHALQEKLEIEPGEVTADGNFSLEVVSCLNACGMAPVIAVNEQLYPGMTPHQVNELIAVLRED